MLGVLDYSTGWPAADAADDYEGVIRYIGTPSSHKNVSPAEAAAFQRRGVHMAFVVERGAAWMLNGSAAGAAAVRDAVDDAIRCGVVIDGLYLAADFDVTDANQMANVEHCLAGAQAVAKLYNIRVGVYGEADVIDACFATGVVELGWQTRAWSAHRVSKNACLLQEIGYVNVGGVQCDHSTVLKADWGQSRGDEMASAEYNDLKNQIAGVGKQVSDLYRLITVGDGGHPHNLRNVRSDLVTQAKVITGQVATINTLVDKVGSRLNPDQLDQFRSTVLNAIGDAGAALRELSETADDAPAAAGAVEGS